MPGLRKKRNPAEETGLVKFRQVNKIGHGTKYINGLLEIEQQKANRRSTVDENQNQRQRETGDTGWHSSARSGLEWQPD